MEIVVEALDPHTLRVFGVLVRMSDVREIFEKELRDHFHKTEANGIDFIADDMVRRARQSGSHESRLAFDYFRAKYN